jgi:hypothetical protein
MVSPIPISGGGGFNIAEMLKFKIISDMGSSTGDSSMIQMFITLIIVMFYDSIIEYVKTLYTRFNTNYTFYQLEDRTKFKYIILLDIGISNKLYKYMDKNNLISKYNLLYYTNHAENTYTNVNKYLSAFKNYASVSVKERSNYVPVKKLTFGDYIYYAPGDSECKPALVCNTSMNDITNFICELEKYEDNLSKEIYENGKNGKQLSFYSSKTFDSIFFEQKKSVLYILDRFQNIEWYKRKGLPYHLTILLKGDPGTGKTSFIKCLANKLNKNIMYVDMSKIKTKTQLFELIVSNYETDIIILEDFDRLDCVMTDSKEYKEESNISMAVVNDLFSRYSDEKDASTKKDLYKKYLDELEKIKKEKEDRLDLAFILNILDGIYEFPGRIILMSCNFPERLAKALLRPGRIDYIIHFKKCNRRIIAELIQHYFDLNVLPNVTGIEEYKYSAAEVSALCKQHLDNMSTVIKKLRSGICNVESNLL